MRRKVTFDPVLRSCAVILTGLTVLGALMIAEDVAAPLLLAIVMGIVFAPTADRVDRLGLPRWISVFALMLVFFALLGTLAYLLEPYIWEVVESVPAIKWEIRSLLHDYQAFLGGMEQVSDGAAAETSEAGNAETIGTAAPLPSMTDALFLAPQILVQMMIFFGGVFFFLLTRDEVYRAIARKIGNEKATDILLQRFCNAELVVARYFLTISLINVGLGTALASGLTLLSMPGAVVWGLFACLMNFVLYLGPLVVASSLLLAGILVFDGAWSFMPPVLFIMLNMIEAQFVTPALVGKNVAINPFVVFASLCFWLWMWGALGGIVAIPVTLVLVKLFDVLGELPMPPDAVDPDHGQDDEAFERCPPP